MSASDSRVYCVIAPLSTLPVGAWIDRTHWPRHVTVFPPFRAGPGDVDALAAVLRHVAAATPPLSAAVGDEALFGPHHDTAVQLVDSGALGHLHATLLDAFGSAVAVSPLTPHYSGAGYRPHVTVTDDRRLERGATLELRETVLVEIAPVTGKSRVEKSRAVAVAVAELGRNETDEPVSAKRAAGTWAALQDRGIRSWVIGGWGIDALVGHQTRDHHDLDLLVLDTDVGRMLGSLGPSALRYLWSENRWHDGLPSAFVADIAGVEVDVHVVGLADGVVRILSEHSIKLPVGALTGSGIVGGVRVACATAEAQRIMHAGYDLPEKQKRDLEALAAGEAASQPL
jgi:lincosamide nucleotidyltransferase A/C/D/E